MNTRSLPWLTAVFVLGELLNHGFSRFQKGLGYRRSGRSIQHGIPRGASNIPVRCYRCGYGNTLKIAYEKVVKTGKIKEVIKYYICEECEKE